MTIIQEYEIKYKVLFQQYFFKISINFFTMKPQHLPYIKKKIKFYFLSSNSFSDISLCYNYYGLSICINIIAGNLKSYSLNLV